jgi:tetratricopeptide (TPR) repeat protein
VHDGRGDGQAALDSYEHALPIFQGIGDGAGKAITLINIGGVYDRRGDAQAALGYFDQALPILQDVGDRDVRATAGRAAWCWAATALPVPGG